jgi:BON domain
MANRESGDYRRYRDRDEEFRGGEFRGGADERGGRGQEGRGSYGGSYGRGYEESGRGMQFGREHEQGGRGEAWQRGSQSYGSRGYQSQPWSPESSRSGRGYSGEFRGYGPQGYGPQTDDPQQRYESFGRESEGIDRSRGFTSGQSYGSSYGQEFGGGTSPYGPGSQSFRGSEGFGRTSRDFGYSEDRLRTPDPTRGRYTGRGPKGYMRSDDRIKEDVNDRLEQHGEIDAWEIVVMVQNGEVTLEGTVPDRRTKRLAEDVAEETSGVKQVHNRLRIQGSAGEGEGSRHQLASGQPGSSTLSSGSTEDRSRTSKNSTRS